jgi:hypothetical protein
MLDMQVSQVAYDRFVIELPPADAEWRPLADPETVAETSAWLWQFGPTPLVAVVGSDRAIPNWLTQWSPRVMKWAPAGTKLGCAVILTTQADLERFLHDGAPHEHTVLMWPRISAAKTFEGLAEGGAAWKSTVDAVADVSRAGERFEVTQVAN